jgi:predicted nucleotidyltransferase
MPKRARRASGRFLLRLPPGLHDALREAAAAAGLSLNDYCVRKLATRGGDPTAVPSAAATVKRAAAVLGEGLVGLVAYGSWTRGETADASDVDVLVVVDTNVSVTRALYRGWDEAPVVWDGRPVDPHFVRLPRADARVGGVWAEAAIDGIVLFERNLEVSTRLIRVRRDIVAGRLVRRVVHGQPYWAEAEVA